MPDLKNGGRQFTEMTLDKFKGIDAHVRDGSGTKGEGREAYGLNESYAAEMSNFNVNKDGDLVKRRGLQLLVDFSTEMGAGPSLRIMGIQRIVSTGISYLHVTDGAKVWRCTTDGTNKIHIPFIGGSTPVQGSYEYVAFAGSAWPAYSQICIRSGNGVPAQAAGGIFTIYGDQPAAGAYAPNSPTGTHLTYFKRRFWALNSMGGTSNNDENRLWYSAPDDPSNWGGAGLPNNIVFDRGGGDYMVTTIPYNDQLLIFMARKTYVLTAEGDPTGWQIRLVSDRVGCIGRRTIKSINGFIYFLSHEGVYKTDGTTFELISGPVNELIDRFRDMSQPAYVVDYMASYWDGKYILWTREPYANPPSDVNCALVYDIELETWTKWDFPGFSFLSEIRFPDKTPDTLLLSEWTSKKVYKMGTAIFADNGAAIKSKWVSKKMFFGFSMQKTRNHLFGMSVRDDMAGATGGNYTVQIVPDDRTGIASSAQPPAAFSVANLKFRGAGYGRYFQTVVEHNGTGFARIYDMTWMNEQRGIIPASYPIRNT